MLKEPISLKYIDKRGAKNIMEYMANVLVHYYSMYGHIELMAKAKETVVKKNDQAVNAFKGLFQRPNVDKMAVT